MAPVSQEIQLQEVSRALKHLKHTISGVILGQEPVIDDLLAALLAGGHVLIEGAPGLGKTRLVRALASSVGLDFGRVQFTPDLMPADITGTTMLREQPGGLDFEFQPGPVFTHLLLADEINRASPKTQSALLEAMEERTVTVGQTQHTLPQPFMVLATQNPLESVGTYTLPEAQLDRFLLKTLVPRPTPDTLKHILQLTTSSEQPSTQKVLSADQVISLQTITRSVAMASSLLDKVVQLIEASHHHEQIQQGISPRGAQALVLVAKAFALIDGRPNVELRDIKRASLPCLRHRLILSFEAELEDASADSVLTSLLKTLG